MAIPKPVDANLEIRMDTGGRLRAYWKGEKLPTMDIQMSNPHGERAEATLKFHGLHVKLVTETE